MPITGEDRELEGPGLYISTKGRYGTKALFELAQHQGAGPVALREIAEKQGLSEHYLEQLVAPPRKAGLVNSVRGAQGGYMLARDPGEITVGDILRVLEGPVSPTECALETFELPGKCCLNPETCPDRDVWIKVRKSIEEVVDNITLADLVEESRRHTDKQLMYYI
jgi:Rrf2 family cysteine metabolism transcriptional repressor